MSEWNTRANEIFLAALEISDPSARRQYVQAACGDDSGLLNEVNGLLRADEAAGRVLHGPLAELEKTASPAPSPDAPAVLTDGVSVGPYRLQSVIAEGGMGVVYEAEQQEPVRRTVALKIIKPGMDSKDVISRFAVERQTLALMDHPNIAQVLDAGSTESGQPYFVMELVRGRPITEHGNEQQLGFRERLELFIQVCQAVQHAHQKGIIHRDIKPSNVLVTIKEGQAVPKVIDFGVAKALDQSLTATTHRTVFTQMVGTPLYMSPEQASLGSVDVDTRSDIYSLGVLLYELLTGTTPYDPQRLEHATYAEFRRIKCEEEPPRPSSRLSGLPGQITTVSEPRGQEPTRSASVLRGELDWIVMKALEHDRQRRYQTARGFAADVQRYLRNEPVEAGPRSATYRVRKFVGRHRGWIAAATLFLVVLILGSGVSLWQAIRATNAEQLALQRLKIAENALAELATANEQLRRNRAQALASNASFLAAIKRYDAAVAQYRAALDIDPYSAFANNNFAWFLVTCPDREYRDPKTALQLAERAVELVPDQGTFWNTLGVCYYRVGSWQQAADSLIESDMMLGDAGTGFNATFLAMAQWQLGNRDEALRHYERAIRWVRDNELMDDEELSRFCREAAQLLGRQPPQREKRPN